MSTLTKRIYKRPIRWGISLLTLAALLCSFGDPESLAATAAGGLPDLVVTGFELSPSQPYAGDSVRLTAVVTNQGTAATPEATVIGGVFLVNDQVVSYTDTFKSSLAPGESVSLTANGGGAAGDGRWIAQAGNHTIGFLVDDVNRTPESDEGNNLFTLSETLVVATKQGPDLVVRDIRWTPEALREGTRLTFMATVANEGNEPTPEGVVLGANFTVDGDVIGYTDTHTSAVAPGESVVLRGSKKPAVGGPWRVERGEYTVGAEVDPDNRIAESVEDNNVKTIDFLVSRDNAETARSADAFVDSVGVATHLSYYDTPYGDYDGIVKPLLEASGIRHIRDDLCPSQEKKVRRLNDLVTIGVRSTLIMSPECVTPEEVVAVVESVAPSIEVVEGPNEPNIFNPELFPDAIRTYHNALYAEIKGDPETASLPVLAPSLAYGTEDSGELGPVACDLGNMHPYQGGQLPDSGFEDGIRAALEVCPGKPFMATETGYNNAVKATSGQPGVSEEAAAKYLPRTYLDFFRSGVARTFAYEFIDEFEDPNLTNPEARFGMVRKDGSPKPSFVAVSNLIDLLADPGAEFTPSDLRYAVNGNVTDLRQLVLQKQDGTHYLILWVNARSYDLATGEDTSVPVQQVSLNLGRSVRRVNSYLPTRSVEIVETFNNPAAVNLDVPDEPLVLELIRSGR